MAEVSQGKLPHCQVWFYLPRDQQTSSLIRVKSINSDSRASIPYYFSIC